MLFVIVCVCVCVCVCETEREVVQTNRQMDNRKREVGIKVMCEMVCVRHHMYTLEMLIKYEMLSSYVQAF